MAAATATTTSIEQQHPWTEEEEACSWAELHRNLVYLIMDKLTSSPRLMLNDFVRFSSVCTSWNVLVSDYNRPPQPLPPHPPLLMIPPSLTKKKKHRTKLRRFYNVCNNKVDASLQVSMPRYRHCRGSSHGWLITIDDNKDDYGKIRLLNPFMGRIGVHEIILPSLDTFPTPCYHYSQLRKAVLSASPITNPTDYMVMAIYGDRLAFFKPGDEVWTDVKLPVGMKKKGGFQDVIYWVGTFYAIHRSGIIVACVEEGGGMAAKRFAQPPEKEYSCTKYLVESSTMELMQVHRDFECLEDIDHLNIDDYGTTLYSTLEFRVFKFVMVNQQQKEGGGNGISARKDLPYKWVEVKNLSGDAMFLGHNASLSISASDYPGCKPNCIYFTDDSDFYVIKQKLGPHDMGVFNLEDGSMERHFPIDPKKTSIQPVPIWPVPIWIQPINIPKRGSNNTTSTSSDEEEEE